MGRKPLDLLGFKSDRISVTKRVDGKDNKNSYWECKCKCGNVFVASGHALKNGRILSCGCLNKEMSGKRNFVDITGERFGKLVARENIGSNHKGKALWKCDCDCGAECIVEGTQLRSGKTKSCGCLVRDTMRRIATVHGMSKSRIYVIYRCMIQRCYDVNYTGYIKYGARGITVCEQWRSSFESFYDWAINNGYDDTLTIDRIDNDKGYSPDNCRWATNRVQANNRRSNIIITANGETHTLKEWSDISGIGYSCLSYRWHSGWDIRDMFIPKGEKREYEKTNNKNTYI